MCGNSINNWHRWKLAWAINKNCTQTIDQWQIDFWTVRTEFVHSIWNRRYLQVSNWRTSYSAGISVQLDLNPETSTFGANHKRSTYTCSNNSSSCASSSATTTHSTSSTTATSRIKLEWFIFIQFPKLIANSFNFWNVAEARSALL